MKNVSIQPEVRTGAADVPDFSALVDLLSFRDLPFTMARSLLAQFLCSKERQNGKEVEETMHFWRTGLQGFLRSGRRRLMSISGRCLWKWRVRQCSRNSSVEIEIFRGKVGSLSKGMLSSSLGCDVSLVLIFVVVTFGDVRRHHRS